MQAEHEAIKRFHGNDTRSNPVEDTPESCHFRQRAA
jgi:hypothetical protein